MRLPAGQQPKFKRNNKFGGTPGQVSRVPGTNVALLSRPDAMPGPAWSLPAGLSCPSMVTGVDSICGVCYGKKGHYAGKITAHALATRFEWTRRCLQTPEGTQEWVHEMFRAIEHAYILHHRYFRGHENGDFFSAAYARAWIRVCTLLPQVRFWFPTRSYRNATILPALIELNALPNVTVRPSALFFNSPPPVIAGLAAGTTVVDVGEDCPKLAKGNTCGHGADECRVCWDNPNISRSYLRH